MARSPEELLGVLESAHEVEAHADRVPALTVPVGGAGTVNMTNYGAYEGASKFDRAVALWQPGLRSADGDLLPAKRLADARVRDIIRNDGYIASGRSIHQDNIVGALYRLNAKPDWKILGLDEKWSEEFQEEVENKFTLWAESEMNWPDASRYNTFTGLVRLAVGIYLSSGEVLASAEWLRDAPRPFKTAVQMIEVDRLSNPVGVPDDRYMRGGVERNDYGAPVAYHVRMAHPADYADPSSYFHKRIKVRKPWGRIQMIHIVERNRPDQTRGMSDLIASLKELRSIKKFRDIVLQNAVVNATYAATLESELPSDAAFAALGQNMTESINGFAGAYLESVNSYSTGKAMHIDGVKIPHLFPGTKLNLRPAGSGGPLGSDFENSLLRYIASNLGIGFEQLSRDYSKANYSSIKASMTETWKFMQSRKRMVADRFASHVYRLWLEEAINQGQIDSLPKNATEMFYEGLNSEAFSACEWIGASRGQVDELKETQAAVMRLRYGLSTFEDEYSRLGKDWRKKFAQIERERKELDKRKIVIDFSKEDSAQNAASGDARESDPNKGTDNAGSDAADE
jgi:lambda family phage portal protein